MSAETMTTMAMAMTPSFRGRVGQGVDAIAGSANKVITGVFYTSFGVLRALIPGQATVGSGGGVIGGQQEGGKEGTSLGTPLGTWETRRMPRRESGFSIASLAASLPGGQRTRSRAASYVGGQRELVEVSSVRSRSGRVSSEEGGVDGGTEESEESREEGGESDGEEGVHDTRSTERTMNESGKPGGRKSLTDRLSSMPGLTVKRERRWREGDQQRSEGSLRGARLPRPNRRFVECAEEDVLVCEVGELLREYRSLVEAVRAAGGFEEE